MPKNLQRPSLEERFDIAESGIPVLARASLRPVLYDAIDRSTGRELTLKLWKKTGTPVDQDLRQLWLHEMRQVQRAMSYSGARDVIVDVIEFVEDERDFGVVLERVGQPLSERLGRVSRDHWIRNLAAPRPRTLFWRNFKRLAKALGIIHSQGLVHGQISNNCIYTEGAADPDFQLSGFEWSLSLSADRVENSFSMTSNTATKNGECYSFAQDWRQLGLLAAQLLGVMVDNSGEVRPLSHENSDIELQVSERVLLKRLIFPARTDQLDAESITNSIDDLIATVTRSMAARAGEFVLLFDRQSRLAEAVYDVTEGEIAIDEFREQLRWVQTDLNGGKTLLVPRDFDPASTPLRLVTDNCIYRIRPFREDGSAVWDIGVCQKVSLKGTNFSFGDFRDHELSQNIRVVASERDAKEARAQLGPSAMDWSTYSEAPNDLPQDEGLAVRQSLALIQVVEAVVKALEVYPLEVLKKGRGDGRPTVIVRAATASSRDKTAKRLGISDSAAALKRLFEDEHPDADGKWRISESPSLGTNRLNDIVASFSGSIDYRGQRAYKFELDQELPESAQYFLRIERDTGTEQAILRRFRNIRAIDSRADLREMLADPWRVRRSSRDELNEQDRTDFAFLDLDTPKRAALVKIWGTLPSYFVVGPPGVGKTKLATEVVRRRFVVEPSSKVLIAAQGHDALDNLLEKVRATFASAELSDILIIRSKSPDNRPTQAEEVQLASLKYLESLSTSDILNDAPEALKDRASALIHAANRSIKSDLPIEREERAGLSAIGSLSFDAANIVVSTANSPDIESLVDLREQFDWVIVEEAAKAIGPELVAPLMLSGRRLLIGDHNQLPPFDSERLRKILSDPILVAEAVQSAEHLIGPLAREGELEELIGIFSDAEAARFLSSNALKLLEPFRTFVEEDERRGMANVSHRPIASVLTEQRRMDPAISQIVSRSFYNGKLTTEETRASLPNHQPSPVKHMGGLPSSPVVVVDFPHVSTSGRSKNFESSRPRWHNPDEVDAVINVLRSLRARDGGASPSLAILSPYAAQVSKIQQRISSGLNGELSHLSQFSSAKSNGKFVDTVDSFQGSEADVVVLSMVRNNAMTGARALGFLRDRRRMNVAMSRAKWHLIIVGSLSFLREAVRGVNPDGEEHDLSFLSEIDSAILELSNLKRNNAPLATIISPDALAASL